MRRQAARSTVFGFAMTAVLVLAVTVGVVLWPSPTPDPPRPPSPAASAGNATPTGAVRIHVVGVGDSVMSGSSCGCDGIPAVYSARLARSLSAEVSSVNLGVGGATAASTERALLGGSLDRAAISSADVLLVVLGANDLVPAVRAYEEAGCDESCYRPLVAGMGRSLSSALGELVRRATPRAQILVGTYWNVFADGDPDGVAGGRSEIDWSRALTVAADTEICRSARTVGARCVDLASPFLASGDPTDLLAADGDHPNRAGVDLIATQFVRDTDTGRLGQAPVSRSR